MRTAPTARYRTGRSRPAAIGLLVVMSILSLVLWIGVPFAWMKIASPLPLDYVEAYVLLLVAVPLTMVAVGWVLYRVNRVYVRISGEQDRWEHTAWLKSYSGDRTSRRPRRAIDVIMACSVALALLALAIWFFFAAGSPLPPG